MDMMTNQSALISKLVANARAAQKVMANSSHDARQAALRAAASQIRDRSTDILATNATDVQRAIDNNVSPAFVDRLTLDGARLSRKRARSTPFTRRRAFV